MAAIFSAISGIGSIGVYDSAAGAAAQQVGSGAKTFYSVTINALLNAGENVFLVLYNIASPVVGTTEPYVCLKCGKAKECTYTCKVGRTFDTALSYAVVREAGGVGATGPSGTVSVKMEIG